MAVELRPEERCGPLQHLVGPTKLPVLQLELTHPLRLGLLVASAGSVSWGLGTFGAFAIGFLFDVFMAWLLTLGFGLLSACWPRFAWDRAWLRFQEIAAQVSTQNRTRLLRTLVNWPPKDGRHEVEVC